MLPFAVSLTVFLILTDLFQASGARGPEVRINGPIGFLLFPIARGLMHVRSFETAFVVLRPLFVLSFFVLWLKPEKWVSARSSLGDRAFDPDYLRDTLHTVEAQSK